MDNLKEFEEYKLKDGEVVRCIEVRDRSKNNKLVEEREETIIKLPTDENGDLRPVDVPAIEKKAKKVDQLESRLTKVEDKLPDQSQSG